MLHQIGHENLVHIGKQNGHVRIFEGARPGRTSWSSWRDIGKIRFGSITAMSALESPSFRYSHLLHSVHRHQSVHPLYLHSRFIFFVHNHRFIANNPMISSSRFFRTHRFIGSIGTIWLHKLISTRSKFHPKAIRKRLRWRGALVPTKTLKYVVDDIKSIVPESIRAFCIAPLYSDYRRWKMGWARWVELLWYREFSHFDCRNLRVWEEYLNTTNFQLCFRTLSIVKKSQRSSVSLPIIFAQNRRVELVMVRRTEALSL